MLSTNDSMSIDTTPTQNGTDSTNTITDLRDLRVGDRVTDRDSDDDAPMLVVYPPMGHGARSEVPDGR